MQIAGNRMAGHVIKSCVKRYRFIFFCFFLLAIPGTFIHAQSSFTANNADRSSIIPDKVVARLSYPKEFKLYNLDIEPLRQNLFSIVDNSAKRSTVIFLPNADGGIEQFEVYEASNFEPDLQARFPEIRAYSGKGITDKGATLKLSISPQGIQTMVFRVDAPNEYIEAYSEDHTVYSAFRSQRAKGALPWLCNTLDTKLASGLNSRVNDSNFTESNTGELRTIRLAQSCNGEYANFFGATSVAQVALVMAAFNATLTRCNGCYEKDLALHLNLIASTTSVIYYNPATDPYTAYNVGNGLADWNVQLQQTLDAVILDANYDIGHMFGRSGGGGNAGCIGCVCDTWNGQTNPNLFNGKGGGITSPADNIPMGDNFDIDYVVHEIGHQLGANHTFSFQLEGTGVNKEVGAGITIMGYAGITNQDPAPHSIDIYHQASIAQIQATLASQTCPVTTNISANNATPVVAALSNVTIPMQTPFALTGSATDANAGDVLTYCWEQNNNSTTTGNNSVASPGKLTGPNWLSFPATTSPTRLFPRLSTILAGLQVTPTMGGDAICNIEALSSVARTLSFRLTVRDNCAYVPISPGPGKIGQTAFQDMTVTVINTAGPFRVTAPNTNVSWPGLSTQTVTWDVNNTNVAPLSTANVKISLSTDGGNTFPTVLLASTANDGSETITVPNTATTTARIKVEAIGNIYFDIDDANFTIVSPSSNLALSKTDGVATYTAGGTTTYTITATNAGPSPNNGATITDNFPLAITSVSWTAVYAGGASGPASGSGNISASVNLPVGGTATLTAVCNISGSASGNLVNTATIAVAAGTTDPVPGNNSGTDTDVQFCGTVTPNPSSQTICSGNPITTIVLTGTAGATFNWARDNTVAVTGIAANASGNISGILTNTTGAPVTVTFTITPMFGSCAGTANTATVTVGATLATAGTAGGPVISQTLNVSGNVIFTEAVNCNVIAGLNPSGGNPVNGNVTAKVWVENGVPLFGSLPYVARHFEIQPATTPTTATGTVVLYFTQAEFTAFNANSGSTLDLPANPGDATGKANLRVYKYQGTSSDGSGLPYTYGGTPEVIDPVDANIIWDAVHSWWTVLVDVTGFSGFTVGTANTLNFCPNGSFIIPAGATGATYQWQVDDNISGYVNISNGPNYSGVTTATLSITALPTNFYGYKYRCLVNGTPSTVYDIKFVTIWMGNSNITWSVGSNWGGCGVVPDQYTDVVIPSGRTNYPVVTATTSIRSIRSDSGSSVDVQPGIILNIVGQ